MSLVKKSVIVGTIVVTWMFMEAEVKCRRLAYGIDDSIWDAPRYQQGRWPWNDWSEEQEKEWDRLDKYEDIFKINN